MFSKKQAVLIFLGSLLFGLAIGCATIMEGGGEQAINIQSKPDGADVSVVDMTTNSRIDNGKTPMICTLKRGRGYFKGAKYKVVVEKEGYSPREVLIEAKANGWYIAGNLFFGGLIGYLIVDPSTGAMYTLTPKEVSADLESATSGYYRDGSLVLVLNELSRIPEDSRERLVKLE